MFEEISLRARLNRQRIRSTLNLVYYMLRIIHERFPYHTVGIVVRFKQVQRFVRTAMEVFVAISALYASGTGATVIQTGLIGYWSGDGNANDSSSLANSNERSR